MGFQVSCMTFISPFKVGDLGQGQMWKSQRGLAGPAITWDWVIVDVGSNPPAEHLSATIQAVHLQMCTHSVPGPVLGLGEMSSSWYPRGHQHSKQPNKYTNKIIARSSKCHKGSSSQATQVMT